MSDENIWDKILESTVEDCLDISDPEKTGNFKKKFREKYLENVQDWMLRIHNFMENDEIKASIWETMEKLDFDDELQDVKAY